MMKAPKLFGEVMAFLIVRTSDDKSCHVVHCKNNASEAWVLKRVAQLIKNQIGDMVLFDNNKKPLSDQIAARMIVELALNSHYKFWKVILTDNLSCSEAFDFGVYGANFIQYSSFDHAAAHAVETLRWYKLG